MLINFNPAIQNKNLNTKKMDKTSFNQLTPKWEKFYLTTRGSNDIALALTRNRLTLEEAKALIKKADNVVKIILKDGIEEFEELQKKSQRK
jgi:hypothetical protein